MGAAAILLVDHAVTQASWAAVWPPTGHCRTVHPPKLAAGYGKKEEQGTPVTPSSDAAQDP